MTPHLQGLTLRTSFSYVMLSSLYVYRQSTQNMQSISQHYFITAHVSVDLSLTASKSVNSC